MIDGKIIQSLHDFNNTPFLKEIEEPRKISLNTGYVALQTNLCFLEKQLDVTL